MPSFVELADDFSRPLWDCSRNTRGMTESLRRIDKVWLKCQFGKKHSYLARLDRLPVEGVSQCPICSFKTVYSDVNSLLVLFPYVVEEMSVLEAVDPSKVVPTSGKKILWYCRKHDLRYKQVLRSKVEGVVGCSLCRTESVSIAVKCPELLFEWDWALNTKTPYEVAAHSNHRVFWKCPLGHRYHTQANDKVSRNARCSVCSGHKVLKGFNDLESQYPEISLEFDVAKNDSRLPDSVYCFSELRFWWKCEKGHSWKTRVNHRTKTGTGCPKCVSNVSEAEKSLFTELSRHIVGLEANRRDLLEGALEIDIYSEAHKIGIEYCGVYWHDPKKFPKVADTDRRKQRLSKERGIHLLVVWEDDYLADEQSVVEDILRFFSSPSHDKPSRFTLDRY